MTTQDKHSEEQAQAQLSSIKEMVANLLAAQKADDAEAFEDAEQVIANDALEIQVRSEWMQPGGDHTLSEFFILLCTGGPAVRIIGTLDDHTEPETVRIEHQDWGTPWQELVMTTEERDAVLHYCRQFYFGA